MDFPQFFRTAITQSQILSNRWRGLALLCKPSDLNRSLRGTTNNDQVMPARGMEFTDRDVALITQPKVCKFAGAVPTTVGVIILAAKPGIRYLIHSWDVHYTLTAIGTTTSVYITLTVDGVAGYPGIVYPVPLTAASYNASAVIDVLCDVNTAVTTISATQNPALAYVNVCYSEVGAS